MKISRLFTPAAVLALLTLVAPAFANEGGLLGRVAYRRSQVIPWHGYNYEAAWGMPMALVVPPTAEWTSNYSWGVGGTHVTPISSQFHRNWYGPGIYDRRGFKPAPPWPSDTNQMGDYYIRGPW
jgi:hypothetical protein